MNAKTTPNALETETEDARDAEVKDSLSNVPQSLQGVFRRAHSGRSRAAGMAAYCYMCVEFDASEVRRCSAPECSLWSYRSVKPKGRQTEAEKAKIRERRETELKCIAAMNKRHVGFFERAYAKRSRADAVRAFSIWCLNGQKGPCGTSVCPLAPYCVGAKE